MPEWKIAVPNPGGSIPEGLLNKIMVGLATVLVLALIISAGFCGGGDETAAGPGEDGEEESGSAGIRAGASVEDELQIVITRQEQRVADAERAAARAILEDERRRERERAAQAAADQAAGFGNIPLAMRQALIDSLGVLPDPDLIEIQRQAQLENAARRITSLRADPVALSFRGALRAGEATTGQRESTGNPGQADLLRALGEAGIQLPQAGGSPPAGELDIPLPGSSRLPDYANPPRLITPADPPGWERVYEGQWLEAVLVTQLTGEFPGPVLAMVSVPFYSADRQRILIPRGSRLIGTAQAVRRRDQSRLAIAFHRLVLLDGRHVPLRFHGMDQAGASGMADQVNRHYLSTFLAAGAVGILSGFALSRGSPYGGGVDGLIASSGQGLAGTVDDILDPFLNRLPTITIRAGNRIRAWFTSDLLIPVPPRQ